MWHSCTSGIARAGFARFCGGKCVAQFSLHFLELDFGGGAFGFALVRDLKALLNRSDQIGVGLFDGFYVKDTTLHFLTNDLVAVS